jgi:hypothetical protein
LLLFIGAQLEDEDIPHRTKMSQLIATRFQIEYDKMIKEIQVRSMVCHCILHPDIVVGLSRLHIFHSQYLEPSQPKLSPCNYGALHRLERRWASGTQNAIGMSRRTRVYGLAMSNWPLPFTFWLQLNVLLVLNPTIKLEWLRENWAAEDYVTAQNGIRAAVIVILLL